MLTYGDMKVFGPGMYLFDTFFEHNFIAKRIFFPEAHKELIEEMIQWHKESLRINMETLVDKLMNPVEMTDEQLQESAAKSKEAMLEGSKSELDEFFETLMPFLETKFGDNNGICCETITFMDVVIYNDIRTVLALYATSLRSKETPKVLEWFQNMNELCPPISDLDNKFDQVVQNRGLGVKYVTDTSN